MKFRKDFFKILYEVAVPKKKILEKTIPLQVPALISGVSLINTRECRQKSKKKSGVIQN